jgi:hypothetical protein
MSRKRQAESSSRAGLDPILKFSECNENMVLALKEASRALSKPRAKILGPNVRGLLHFLQTPVVCIDGCYFLNSPEKDWRFVPDAHFPDRSGLEWSWNKVHALDLWQDQKFGVKPGIHNLVLGLIVAEVLRIKLVCAHPAVRFLISVSWHVKGIGDRELDRNNVRRDCCVFFHAARPGEDVLGDLEGYKTEAVGVFATRPLGLVVDLKRPVS